MSRQDRPGPFVAVNPAIRFGRPNIKGISVDVLAELVWNGDDVEVVADEYGITRPEVLVACWFTARYGTRTWRKRWAGWVQSVDEALWRSDYNVQDPPSREEAK